MTLRKKIENGAGCIAVLALALAALVHMWLKDNQHAMAAPGQTYMASIDGGQIKTKRGVISASLNLSWVDERGFRQSAQEIGLTGSLRDRIIKNKTLTIDQIEIKVLDGQARPHIVEQLPLLAKSNEEGQLYFGVSGIVSAMIWLGLLLTGRKRREADANATITA
jgi:hypothetical protein